MINGANSRLVSHITGKSTHEEASKRTRTFDLVACVRARRLQWMGHILRMDPKRLVHKAVHYLFDNKSEGDILMDARVANMDMEGAQRTGAKLHWMAAKSKSAEAGHGCHSHHE